MLENGFEWRRDSNYLSANKISLRNFHKIEKEFCEEFSDNLSCILKMDVNIHQKEMSMSFIKSINKTIYNNLSKQNTKSYSKQKPQEQEDSGMEM